MTERLSYPINDAIRYSSADMEIARLRGYEQAVMDMAESRRRDEQAVIEMSENRYGYEHRYVYQDDNGGVCACGAGLSWYGRVSNPGWELAAHIKKTIQDANLKAFQDEQSPPPMMTDPDILG